MPKERVDRKRVAIKHSGEPVCAKLPHLFFSDKEKEIARAIKLCNKCPDMMECRAAAAINVELAGVWGGVDFSPTKARLKFMHANGVYVNGKWILTGELAETEIGRRSLEAIS